MFKKGIMKKNVNIAQNLYKQYTINQWNPELCTGVSQTIKMDYNILNLNSEICETQCCFMELFKTKNDIVKMEIPKPTQNFI